MLSALPAADAEEAEGGATAMPHDDVPIEVDGANEVDPNAGT